jgi:hypothetical protein
MKKLIPIFLLLLPAVFFSLGNSCDNEGGSTNLLQALQANPELASLESIIVYVDFYTKDDPDPPEIQMVLADPAESLTVFGPNNDAFIAVFGDADGDDIVEDVDIRSILGLDDNSNAYDLADVLSYHVIYNQALSADDIKAKDGDSIGPTDVIPAVNLDVTVTAGVVNLAPDDGGSSADIIQEDIVASNGIAHIIDAVMGL